MKEALQSMESRHPRKQKRGLTGRFSCKSKVSPFRLLGSDWGLDAVGLFEGGSVVHPVDPCPPCMAFFLSSSRQSTLVVLFCVPRPSADDSSTAREGLVVPLWVSMSRKYKVVGTAHWTVNSNLLHHMHCSR